MAPLSSIIWPRSRAKMKFAVRFNLITRKNDYLRAISQPIFDGCLTLRP